MYTNRLTRILIKKIQIGRKFYSSELSTYRYIKVERCGSNDIVGIVTLNRSEVKNAISACWVNETINAIKKFDADKSVGAIVITGIDKIFSEHSDIIDVTPANCIKNNFPDVTKEITRIQKPIIATVNGCAVGEGCAVAMMCDIIYAETNAKFRLPEIFNGMIPDTRVIQRLTHTIGKSKAMEMIITGETITSQEAEKCGLVTKIFPSEQLMKESVKMAEHISRKPRIAVVLAKESVNLVFENSFSVGNRFEQALFYLASATKDCKEGALAFFQKRDAKFINE